MEYNDAISYLYGLQVHGIKLGLHNIKTLLTSLDNPQDSFRSIHIAGTNGKGSTASMVQMILREYGFKAGLFTSPHLVRFTERIKINNIEMSENDVVDITGEIVSKINNLREISPTFFEVVTAMAFLYFQRNNADWAVIETGLGGRFDATNTISPELTIITKIGRDHEEYLGSSLESIAGEKAGIVKRNAPVITTSQEKGVLNVISKIAVENSSPLYIYGKDFDTTIRKTDSNGTVFDYKGENRLSQIMIPLIGVHQTENAACAIKAWEIMHAWKNENRGGDIRPETRLLKEALKKTKLSGRCEFIKYKGIPVILDGAHNPGALGALVDSIKNIYLGSNTHSNGSSKFSKVILIFGAMKDKAVREMLEEVIPIANKVIFTSSAYDRAENPEHLLSLSKDIFKYVKDKDYYMSANLADAFSIAKGMYNKGDLVIITGSFYIVGEVKELIGEETLLKNLVEFK